MFLEMNLAQFRLWLWGGEFLGDPQGIAEFCFCLRSEVTREGWERRAWAFAWLLVPQCGQEPVWQRLLGQAETERDFLPALFLQVHFCPGTFG